MLCQDKTILILLFNWTERFFVRDFNLPSVIHLMKYGGDISPEYNGEVTVDVKMICVIAINTIL